VAAKNGRAKRKTDAGVGVKKRKKHVPPTRSSEFSKGPQVKSLGIGRTAGEKEKALSQVGKRKNQEQREGRASVKISEEVKQKGKESGVSRKRQIK